MKKFMMIMLALVLGASALDVSAQSKEYKKMQAEYQKIAAKTAKKQAKELKKQKWEYTGIVPLEMALEKFYLETTDFGGTKKGIEHELNAKTVSTGEASLLLNAQALYAQEYENMLKADLAKTINANDERSLEEYASRIAAKVKHEFNGDITRSIMLKRPSADGRSWTVRAYYLVNEDEGRLRSKRIADEVERTNGLIDLVHEKTFGNE